MYFNTFFVHEYKLFSQNKKKTKSTKDEWTVVQILYKNYRNNKAHVSFVEKSKL